MKVTPVKKAFGKYQPGQVFEFPSKAAKVYIKLGKLAEVGGDYERKVVEPSVEMNAELDAAGDRGLDPPEVEISPRTGLPKRVYRRRDMESE